MPLHIIRLQIYLNGKGGQTTFSNERRLRASSELLLQRGNFLNYLPIKIWLCHTQYGHLIIRNILNFIPGTDIQAAD